jgi:hypothetical protein
MYAVVRTYEGPGADELFDLLDRRKAEVEAVMRTVPGLVSYTLVRTSGGGGRGDRLPRSGRSGSEHSPCEGMDTATRIRARFKPT